MDPQTRDEPQELIDYDTAAELAGMPRRTLQDRIAAYGITVYVSGRDRRRRLIDRRDVARLIAPVIDERRAGTAA